MKTVTLDYSPKKGITKSQSFLVIPDFECLGTMRPWEYGFQCTNKRKALKEKNPEFLPVKWIPIADIAKGDIGENRVGGEFCKAEGITIRGQELPEFEGEVSSHSGKNFIYFSARFRHSGRALTPGEKKSLAEWFGPALIKATDLALKKSLLVAMQDYLMDSTMSQLDDLITEANKAKEEILNFK